MPLTLDQLDRGFVADRAVRSLLVVVSTPSLAFSSRIVEAHEPMRVQTFRSEFAVERLDEGAQVSFGRVWPIAGPRAALPGPWMDFVHDQLATSGPRKLNRGS